MSPPRDEARAALFAGLACYTFWGLVPLLFQLISLSGAGPFEIIGHRTFWSVFWAAGLVFLAGQVPEVRRLLASPRTLGLLALSTLLISINWTLYVWAVTHGRTLDTSLGYYMTPLINMAAGAVVFRERIDRFALIAMGLAAAGVALQGIALGHVPWIALVLSFSFGGYGIVRKRVRADAQSGLFIECLFLTVPGGLYLLWLQTHGQGHFFTSAPAAFGLFLAGPATVIPLALFSWAARRMPLSSMAFLQFLGPTIAFVVGVVEGESIGGLRGVSFAVIWAGVAVYAWGAWRATRTLPAAPAPAPEVRARTVA